MKKYLIIILGLIIILSTGCLKQDKMEDINIITTIYPIEYATNRLYGNKSTVKSIYPKGSVISKYELTKKQLKDYSKNDLFIYNGSSKEKDYATEMIDLNKRLKIIDASYGIESGKKYTDIWLNPANMLMIAQNIKNELNDYIYSDKIKESIEKEYTLLKVDITEIEAGLKKAYNDSVNKQIIVADESLNFLERYGFEIISLTKDGKVDENNVAYAKRLFSEKKVNYIFVMEHATEYEIVKKLKEDTKFETITYRTLETITDKDIENKDDYLSLMTSNINKIKQETLK